MIAFKGNKPNLFCGCPPLHSSSGGLRAVHVVRECSHPPGAVSGRCQLHPLRLCGGWKEVTALCAQSKCDGLS